MPARSCECGTCGTCLARAASRQWMKEHPEQAAAIREHNRARTAAYRAADPERAKRQGRENMARYRAKTGNTVHSEARAHRILNGALKRGYMTRQPCERCGAEKTDAHHDDYSRPLDVRWLCRRCHMAVHKEQS